MAIAVWAVEESRNEQITVRHIDMAGAAPAGLGLGRLSYVLVQDPAVGRVTLAGFVLQLRLFRIRKFSAANGPNRQLATVASPLGDGGTDPEARYTRHMSGLSSQQIGKVGERILYKLLILGSRGRLEAYIPVADEERRDLEVHIKGQYLPIIAFQVKCHTRLWYGKWRKFARLSISFRILGGNIRTDKLFWYVFASLDVHSMAFRDPAFIIPSAEVHKHARIPGGSRGRQVAYSFVASLDPHSRDKWSRYRVAASDVGARVLQILRESSSASTKAA